ncbi:16S rRNA (cytidine1402-2'-O)-methyltransferase [Entomoplasma freundtii]|uniref:Ribosomal RNA small subunit methyltransferase I n=1 Tax=Entomoplasma freundtii TaxID=74700 RepID=A0A2K8NS24_9MOLU|nr:16S rRNA (cytidine(1402)-2'-O)-methyltransferase [Entomoplasma freundtii]ATZ16554.1 16S rRNA (cytidine1402-2'-O)-methyltransferase [Entomoplasma freundtii]TDY58280.1 16S rRNA (cytidine1402-2'-O)-methyltransferase [Entomoplasma freundtii]
MIRCQKTFKSTTSKPTLYLVGTPIGNLADLSPRAQTILQEVDWIFCEDTRTTEQLLKHYGIQNKLISCHKFNEQSRVDKLQQILATGQSMALVSDAGVPIISDPGAKIVREILHRLPNQINVSGVNVGPAYIHALVASGYESPNHYFYGFLKSRGFEAKKRELTNVLMTLPEKTIIVFYESVHRIKETIAFLAEILPPTTSVMIARELTKTNEEIIQGPISELAAYVAADQMVLKGEFVVLVSKETNWSKNWTLDEIVQATQKLTSEGHSLKAAASIISLESGWPKNKIYQLMVEKQK